MGFARLLEIIVKIVAAIVIMGINLVIFGLIAGWGWIGLGYSLQTNISMRDIYIIIAFMAPFIAFSSFSFLIFMSAFLNYEQLLLCRNVLAGLLFFCFGLYLLTVTWLGLAGGRLTASMTHIIFISIVGLACLAIPAIKAHVYLGMIRRNGNTHQQLALQLRLHEQSMKPPKLPEYFPKK